MILTVCLSPKIDVNMEVDNLSVGIILSIKKLSLRVMR